MRLLGRNREKGNAQDALQEKVANRIASSMLKVQTKFAHGMERLCSKASAKTMKVLLILFCSASGGLSMYYVLNAVLIAEKRPVFKIDRARILNLNQQRDIVPDTEILVDEDTWQKIQVFKQYMDSLRLSESKKYDSIILSRPGLMDSIAMVEELYYSQKSK